MRKTVELALHERQYDFVFSPARYAFYVGGRGAGKSFAGALRAIFATQAQPGSLGLVGAPTHPMLRDAAHGTQAALIATIHKEVSAGNPVVVTMPSQWGTAPADPLHPSGYTHVGVAVGIGPSGIRVMNPWHGFMQDEDDSWWQARLCYGQVWVMKKASGGTTMTTTTTGVPAGWRDDGKILTAPNGITVGTGIRERVLGWPGGWPAWNVPLEEEHHMASLERFNPSLGAGTQQVFRATVLEWTPTHGTIMMAVGAELQATRAALATAQSAEATAQTALATAQQQATHDAAIISDQQGQISTLTQQVAALRSELDVADAQVATLQRQVAALQASIEQAQQQQADAAAQASEAQAQAGDELARGAAHAFVTAFTAAVAAAVAATPAATPAPALGS